MTEQKARDLFAGIGWALAARQLGIEDHGWDDDSAVVQTRKENGLVVAGGDVLGVRGAEGGYTIEIGSPPCERFSTAGHGDGNSAITSICNAVALLGRGYPSQARSLLEREHPKTALVIEPLRVVLENPHARHIVWEQVPSVLPVWRACAPYLEREGWSVATGVVDAAWYGTPQNRRRAVLIARLDGTQARIPEPTRSVCLGDAFPELPSDWLWRSNYSDSPSYGTTAAERGRMTRTMRQCAGTITRKAWNWQRPDWSLAPAPPSHSARIQGFPPDMVWPDSVAQQRMIIGNAVPIPMAVELLKAAVL